MGVCSLYSFANYNARACVEVFASRCLAVLCDKEEQSFKWQKLAAGFMIHDPEIQLRRKKADQDAGVAMAMKLCRVLGEIPRSSKSC